MQSWSSRSQPAGSNLAEWLRDQFRGLAEALRSPGIEVVTVRKVTANDTVRDTDAEIRVDATGGAVTLTLPAGRTIPGHRIMVIRLNAGGNNVTIAASGTELINLAPTKVLGAQFAAATLIPWQDGTTFGFDAF